MTAARANPLFADLRARVTQPRLDAWTPQDGPQRSFYESACDEVLYGGAAGGGKSSCAVALPLRWTSHPRYRALILRRETPQLEGLLDEAKAIYKNGNEASARPFRGASSDAVFNGTAHTWTFLSGARVRFNHCQYEDDAFNYQGHEYQTIIFDELTHFTEKQYLEIKSRNRSSVSGLPCYTRATTNPGGVGAGWVMRRWGPWLDPKCELPDWTETVVCKDGTMQTVSGKGLPSRGSLPPAVGGTVLFVAMVNDVERFSTEPFTVDGVKAQTRTFIPAKLSDNKALMQNDPGYLANLRALDPVRRAQLEDGNWLVGKKAGEMFQRQWFEIVDEVPANAQRVRAWDFAATEPSPANPDPDWTVGLKLAKDAAGFYYVEDIVRFRGSPGVVNAKLKTTTQADGKSVRVRVPQDPAQAGKSQVAAIYALLEGYPVRSKPPTGDKALRARPVSAQCSPQSTGGMTGKVRVKRAPWNDVFFNEVESFPTNEAKDDQVDALSDAYDELLKPDPFRGMLTESLGIM